MKKDTFSTIFIRTFITKYSPTAWKSLIAQIVKFPKERLPIYESVDVDIYETSYCTNEKSQESLQNCLCPAEFADSYFSFSKKERDELWAKLIESESRLQRAKRDTGNGSKTQVPA